MQKPLSKRILNALLLLSLTIFAFWFALKDDYQLVLRQISKISWVWLVFILALGILYYILQGIVLYLIGRTYKKDMRVQDGIDNAFIAAFFNGVTPLGGGQVAQTYAFRKLRMKYHDIASTLWMDFFIFQSVVLIYAGLLIIFKFTFALEMFPQFLILIIVGFLVNSSVIVCLWTMIRFPKIYTKISAWIIRLLHRLHIIKDMESTTKKWNQQLLYFQQEVNKLKHFRKLIFQCGLLYVFRQTLFYILPFIVAYALGVHLPLSDLINVIAISAFIHMLNALTPLPGDTGWTETAFILLFGLVFGRTNASSVMILWRLSTYHLNVIIGGIRFMKVKSKKVKKAENTQIKSSE